jgi:hypothetical protein
MLKTVNRNLFDVVVGLMIIVALFYLAAITRIMPLPESALTRIGEIAVNVMNVFFAFVVWLASFLP